MISLRLKPMESYKIDRQCEKLGVSRSAYMREAALVLAEKIAKDPDYAQELKGRCSKARKKV